MKRTFLCHGQDRPVDFYEQSHFIGGAIAKMKSRFLEDPIYSDKALMKWLRKRRVIIRGRKPERRQGFWKPMGVLGSRGWRFSKLIKIDVVKLDDHSAV